MSKFYAGIGSRRRTPSFIHEMMESVASKLETKDYILRSGGAQGADKAFESGVQYDENKQIFRPKHATIEAINLAANFHPYWDECDTITRKLHGRNSMIILGEDLSTPVQFVICYTPDGKASGGTGVGIRIAESFNIPVFNLAHTESKERIEKFIEIKREEFDVL
jgi:hypothetical protein